MTAQEVAKARLLKAMEQIEQAQVLLNLAAENICPLRLTAAEWARAGRLYDQVKTLWYRLERRLDSGKFELDRPANEILQREAEGVAR